MKKVAETFLFREDEKHPEVSVTRMPVNAVHLYAEGVLKVMAQAYERQFETGNQLLKPGDSRTEFDFTDEERVKKQQSKMLGYIKKHRSSYWLAYQDRYFLDPAFKPIGIAKTSPSRPRLRPWEPPNCYLNDIAVAEPHQGIGDAVLFAALSDFDGANSVVADVARSSESYFVSLGFEKTRDNVSQLNINGTSLAQDRYEAETISLVRGFLIARQQRILDAGPQAIQ